MFRSLIILSFLLSILIEVKGQETIFEEKTTIYVDEYSGGLSLHTAGFSLKFRYGKYSGAFSKKVYEFEFATINHPREVRTVSQLDDNVRGYVFGKMNSFFALRPSVGFHNVFVPKQSIRGVSITRVLQIGPSLGLAKPIYLNVQRFNDRNQTRVVSTEAYSPDRHRQNDIIGRASFFNGFSEMRVYPGIFTKFAFEFEYSTDRESIRTVEAGITSDFYFSEIPIMAFADNSSWFLNLYVAIMFGQKNTK